jgi:hypothetical protein
LFGKEFPRNLFWACFLKGMSIWHIKRKGMQKSKMYSIKFAQSHICKIAAFDPKNLKREDMNGIRLRLNLEFGQEN